MKYVIILGMLLILGIVGNMDYQTAVELQKFHTGGYGETSWR